MHVGTKYECQTFYHTQFFVINSNFFSLTTLFNLFNLFEYHVAASFALCLITNSNTVKAEFSILIFNKKIILQVFLRASFFKNKYVVHKIRSVFTHIFMPMYCRMLCYVSHCLQKTSLFPRCVLCAFADLVFSACYSLKWLITFDYQSLNTFLESNFWQYFI